MAVLVTAPPCVVHEDEQILVVNKPAGLNTHSPSPFAGEGLYEWLRNWEPRWRSLAIIHRLDKATSGIIVFAKTRIANQSLTEQFTHRRVQKKYLLLSAKPPPWNAQRVKSGLMRLGERYAAGEGGELAETSFEYLGCKEGFHLLAAEPLTGRTHQIRVHAQLQGIPVLGDSLYGGSLFRRVCLHWAEIRFLHPDSQKEAAYSAEPDFFGDPAFALRKSMIRQEETTAFRILNGSSDQVAYYLDRWGEFLLAQTESSETAPVDQAWHGVAGQRCAAGLYHKTLTRHVAKAPAAEAAPRFVFGTRAPAMFQVRENGVQYEISFEQGYSVGLFLDQRENRRRLLTNYIAPDFSVFAGESRTVLNCFSYTCAFSVCAALAGAHTTSLDLSKNYLEWGKRNFQINGIDPRTHDFIYGDALDWGPRLAKKGRRFAVIILDPPTFSRGEKGVFQAERDFGKLVRTFLPLLEPGGVLFAATNAQKFSPENFLGQIREAVLESQRAVRQWQYIPQPIDFPISKEEPAYLKTVWMRIS